MILIDTSFFIAFINSRDRNNSRAKVIMQELFDGIYGLRITLDYVLDEAITTTWVRTKNQQMVEKMYQLINGRNSSFDLRLVDIKLIDDTWINYQKYFSVKKPISFTDSMLISFAKKNNVNQIVSFDNEFDGILNRIC